MEGLTILYSEKYIAGHEFDLTAFLVLSIFFTIIAFIVSIGIGYHEDGKDGIGWGIFVGFLMSIVMTGLTALIATISQPIYKDQYACTIDFNIIDQEKFQSKYEIVETKGTMYVIREKGK